MIDVSERILGISVTEALRKFDPSKGAKFTTFLYRILKFHAIKEYLVILKNVQADGVIVDYDSDAMNEVECYAEKGFERIDTMDMINFCVTIPDEEFASTKHQYLPKPLQNLPDEPLRQSLSDLDREIFELLVTDESQHEIRHDIERRWASGTEHRKFFHSRCKAIARRGKIE
ncbi:hypothetical protein FACS18942_07160 [Planctomycetales bacterium]|nr:hypothetical protein FACS18942_07160 [Planctomycetales bacterium]GHT39597.1 hypothetical protein FACS189427_13640 [Planctomycetales bacterium]